MPANRTKYLQHVSTCYNMVTLPIGPTEGFSLQAIFQPLALRSDPLTIVGQRQKRRALLGESSSDGEVALVPDETEQHAKQPPDEQLSQSHKIVAEHGEDALKKSPHGRIIILGGPGTGKTTTLKYLVGKCAQEALNDPSAPVPIYLSLVDLARCGKALQSYLSDLVEKMGVERSYGDILWQEIERGHAFVALDSLDEVDPRQRLDIIDMINDRASQKGNTWLVGSRFSEYKGGQFKRGQFSEWELLPMTPQLRRSLAERLLPELSRLFNLSPSEPSLSTTFIHQLENHPQVAAWGENPLLLSLAAVIYVKTGGLPSSRALLYCDVINAVLAPKHTSALEASHLLRHLMDLALWLSQNRKRIFTSHDLFAFLEEVGNQSIKEAEQIAQRMIACGILDHLAQDTYSFRHQTFQEYLAGASLAMQLTDSDPTTRQKAWNLAWSKRTYSRWTEILRLMVGVLVQLPDRDGPAKALDWLKALVAQRTSEEGDPGDLGLTLALQSFGEVADVQIWKDATVLQFQRQVLTLWLDALFLAARMGREARREQLEGLTESVISHLDEKFVLLRLVEGLRARDESVRWAASHMLQKAGKRVTTALLLPLLQDQDGNVRVVAVEVLKGLGERVPLEVLVGALGDSDSDVRVAAVEVLKGLGERVPLDVLVGLLGDSLSYVRVAVVRALGQLGERVPLEVLVGALGDSDSEVRAVVVRALGEQGERVSLDLLVGALSDSDSEVRAVVVRALGEQGERVPLDLLVGALSDSDEYVRAAAVRALGGQGERVSLDLLVGALGDSNKYLRKAAVEVLGKQGDRVSLDVLVGTMGDSSWKVREAAVRALGEQGERVPFDLLVVVLGDSSWKVREAAVEFLKKRAPEALDPIVDEAIAILQKRPAGFVLGSLIQGDFLDIIKESGYSTPEVLTKVTELLDWPYWEVRMKAAETLGVLRRTIPDAAIKRLLALRRDPDPLMRSVREAADDALAEILSLEDGIEDD